MISRSELILLDTNILIHLIRGNSVAQWIDSQFGLRSRAAKPLISVVTIGESLALAKKLNWGSSKAGTLESLLREMVVADINSAPVLKNYAEVDHALQKIGKPIQQNDMWIAATAMAFEAHLLTTDRDFDYLSPKYVSRTWIDPKPSGNQPRS